MIDELLSRIEPSPVGTFRSALLLGDAARHEPALRERGWRVQRGSDGPAYGAEPGTIDAVIAENVICRDPWDRWALQRMHDALRTGGLLMLSEPNQLDLGTPGGMAYVASRGAREVARKLRRMLKFPISSQPSLKGRRPSPGGVGHMLAGLRFGQIDVRVDRGLGWGQLLPPKFAPRFRVSARALPTVVGLTDAWPDRAAHCAAYEQVQGYMLRTRTAWLRANERWTVKTPALFDPSLYAGRTVLALAPHPDDEIIGAAGALLKLVQVGARIVCVQATDGSAGAALEGLPDAERREVRLREAATVAARLGVARIEYWRADNRAFLPTADLVDRMRRLLEEESPALIFIPFVTEAHEDHITLDVILSRAIRAMKEPPVADVLGYEVWSVVPPTHVHDITPVMGEFAALLECYDCAMRIDDFVHFCADRALYHGFQLRNEAIYLEAFHSVAAKDYPELLRTVNPPHGD